jgi:NADH:ubiquinone oxidoreductase subunit B-like Fe-S oxidoreductase
MTHVDRFGMLSRASPRQSDLMIRRNLRALTDR